MTTKPAEESEEEDTLSAHDLSVNHLTTYQGGYDCEVVSPLPDELVCLICRCIARVPYQVQCCGQVFCEGCLTLLKLFSEKQNILYKCPHCRHTIQSFMDVRAAYNIKSLEVKCKNAPNGCEWIGKLSSLEEHQDGCGFTLIVCPHEDGENAMKFLQKNLFEHYKTECPRRRYQCSYCHESGEYRDMIDAHLKECPDYTLPEIYVHPCHKVVRSGDMVIFNVRADKALHYQWSRDGQDITHMTHSYCKGATTSTLYIRAVAEEHEGRYNCAVSNDIGSVDSESAELVVVTLPTITGSPCDQTKMYGDDVTFTVTASGRGTFQYQWSKDGEDITSDTHPYCTGANTPTLNIIGVITPYEGSYMCHVSNEAGCVESQNATLGVVSPATRLFQKEDVSTAQNEDVGTEEQKCYPVLPPLSAPTRLCIGSSEPIENSAAAAKRDIKVSISGQTARQCRGTNVHLTIQNLSSSSSSVLLPSDIKLFSPIYRVSMSSNTLNLFVKLTIAHYANVEPGESTSDFMILQSSDQSPPYHFRCLDENMLSSVLQHSVSCTVKLGPANFYAIGASIWRRAQFTVYFIQPQPKVSQQCMYALFAASYKHAAFEELLLSEVERRFQGVRFQLSKHSVHLREGSDRFKLVLQESQNLTDLGYSLIPINKGSMTILANDILKRDANKDPRLCMPPTVLLRIETNNPFEDLECVLRLSGVVGNDHEFVLQVQAPYDQPTDHPGTLHMPALMETYREDGAATPTFTKISHEHVGILVEILSTHAGKWKFIGTCLGFTQPELGTIEADLRLLVGGPQAYLTAMLDQWTTWPVKNLGVEHKRCATLEDLEQALKSRLVGLGVVASELRGKFEQGCENRRAENEQRIRDELGSSWINVLQPDNEPDQPVPGANVLQHRRLCILL